MFIRKNGSVNNGVDNVLINMCLLI